MIALSERRIIFFDIDHTLYDPFYDRIPPSALEALRKVHEKGDTILAVATGRAYHMLSVIDEVADLFAVFVTINGRIILHRGEIVHDDPFPQEEVARIKALFSREGLCHGFIGKHTHAVSHADASILERFERQRLPLPITDKDFDRHNDVYQMWAIAPKEEHARLAALLPRHDLVAWLEDGFDVIHPEKDKGSGVEKALELLDIPKERAYCFGDAGNDIGMLAGIPNSIAMGNASDTVKRHARHITAPLSDDGIAKALHKHGFLD